MMAPWARKLMLVCRLLHPDGAFTENRSFTLNIIGRWLIAVFLIVWNADSGAILFASIFAAVLIVPEVTTIASAGFTSFIDSLFFPGSREKKPPYTLKLARFYVQKQRWDDAEAEYARMLSFYPDQLEAWKESLHVAFAQGENADPAPDAILSKGLKKLKTPAEKEALFATFNAKEKPVIVPEPESF
ncbi:MAG: tetratricopeptide repeat protein [Verrucomicrobiota bacterium]